MAPDDPFLSAAAACVQVQAVGIVDAHGAREFFKKLHVLIQRSDIELDMSRVTGLDSTGVGALLSIAEAGRDRGFSLRLRAPSAIVRLAVESAGGSTTLPFRIEVE